LSEHTGEVLAADLHRLLVIARDRLPKIAETYLDATEPIARTARLEASVFRNSRIAPLWKLLREELHTILVRTNNNIIETAAALEHVVEYYTSVDEEASAALKTIIAEHAQTNPAISTNQVESIPRPEMPEE